MKAKPASKKLSLQAHPGWWLALGIVMILALVAVVWSGMQSQAPGASGFPFSKHATSPSPSPSPSSQLRAGQPSARNLGTPTPTPSVVTLAPPQGDLLNVHSTSLASGATLVSTCSTQAGAKCYVQAKNGATVKTTGAVAASTSGAAEIDWNAKAVGLTTGTWEIRVVATLGDQTATSIIYDSLEVKP